MQLGEVYQLKTDDSYRIIISRFASNNKKGNDFIIIADIFQCEEMLWTSPSFCIYFDNKEEILEDYKLVMTQKEFQDYIKSKQ